MRNVKPASIAGVRGGTIVLVGLAMFAAITFPPVGVILLGWIVWRLARGSVRRVNASREAAAHRERVDAYYRKWELDQLALTAHQNPGWEL